MLAQNPTRSTSRRCQGARLKGGIYVITWTTTFIPGNYAAALLADQEAREAGFASVMWLDAEERRGLRR